eukprot:4531168-Amphidinium_carterae.1
MSMGTHSKGLKESSRQPGQGWPCTRRAHSHLYIFLQQDCFDRWQIYKLCMKVVMPLLSLPPRPAIPILEPLLRFNDLSAK